MRRESGWDDKYGKLPPFHGIGVAIGAMAAGAKGDDPFGYRAEFLDLVRLARSLDR